MQRFLRCFFIFFTQQVGDDHSGAYRSANQAVYENINNSRSTAYRSQSLASGETSDNGDIRRIK